MRKETRHKERQSRRGTRERPEKQRGWRIISDNYGFRIAIRPKSNADPEEKLKESIASVGSEKRRTPKDGHARLIYIRWEENQKELEPKLTFPTKKSKQEAMVWTSRAKHTGVTRKSLDRAGGRASRCK